MSEEIKLEMTWTPYENACRTLGFDDKLVSRLCRRHARHTGVHASDYPYFEWKGEENGDECV